MFKWLISLFRRFLKWLGSLFIDSNEKELKRLQPAVARINELEPQFERLSDDELRAKTDEFKARLKAGSSLDELLPEAFAAVRQAAKRTIGQRHFDVQLMGGVGLHQGKIAEMKTGEGKTLVATLPLYLNSLTGQGCHLATVNDYLARRDPYWMGPIYHALGVSVASIYPQQTPDEHIPSCLYDPGYDSGDKRWTHFRPITRREAYQADITYGTSSEFGFDYLRDNMVIDLSQCVQHQLSYAIVDEVDNLLIDEARTPLIISAPDVEATQRYQIFARLVPRLRQEQDYVVDEKTRTVNLTDAGIVNVERMLKREGLLKSANLYDPSNYSLTHHLDNAVKAHVLYKKDREYMVKDGQVIIVDEFTGRLMLGRRYSEGLHQAIEAKEHVRVQRESRTFATITIQNYFRMYDKLAGMTGTAVTEAEEFHKIYKLEVVVIPTNEPMIREDFSDQIYKDEATKFKAVAREIEQLHKQGRPMLVGTVSIEKSEYLSDLLNKSGVPYQILNAKYHEKEAHIIAQAGQPGAVTVATNMAGRGVDIVLGGQEKQVNPYTDVESYYRGLYELYGGKEDQYKEHKESIKGKKRYVDNHSFYKVCNEVVQKLKTKYEEYKRWLLQEGKLEQIKEENEIGKKSKEKELEEKKQWIEKYERCKKWVEQYEEHREWLEDREKVLKLDGLHIIGTERHEARRIDNQLRGRAGRQGDPGSSRFYVSLEDDIVRRFGGDRIKGFMEWAGMDEDTPIENKLVNRSIEGAQVRVEGYHFDMRKHLVEYDDVINKHRELIYGERRKILSGADLKANILSMVSQELQGTVAAHTGDGHDIDWNLDGLVSEVSTIFPLPPSVNASALSQMKSKEIEDKLIEQAEALYEEKERELGSENMRVLERLVMLRTIDNLWVEHLTEMDNMRQGIGLMAVAQRDPLVAYKREGHNLFQNLLSNIQHDVVHTIYRVGIVRKEAPQPVPAQVGGGSKKRLKVGGKKIGRNDPCPCGSGKKYKHCCGR